jgi:hypothetical protein
MLNVIRAECLNHALHAQFPHAECRYAKCHFAECRGANLYTLR